MAAQRYNLIPEDMWAWLGPAPKGLNLDLKDVTARLEAIEATGVQATGNISAGQVTTGVLSPARLGTGTASASTFLAGDGTWKTPPAGGGTGTDITIRQNSDGTWPTITRVAGAHYRWLCAYDPTKWPPIAANAAATGDELVGADAAVIP